MRLNTFNICPTCIHRDTCVLTTQKSQVWSCSEYEEDTAEARAKHTPLTTKKEQPEMAMA